MTGIKKVSPLTDEETKEYYILRYAEEEKEVPMTEHNKDGFKISNKAHTAIVLKITTEMKNPDNVRNYLQTEKERNQRN
jgi:hypothetical protein